MIDPSEARNALIQSQPEVYRASEDAAARLDLARVAQADPQAVIDVLLDDLIWRLYLESLVTEEDTPALDQLVELARAGDFDLAYQRTKLAMHLDRNRKLLFQRVTAAGNEHLTTRDDPAP
ncbi:MAG: hypothetical protein ACOYL5_17405 [Phototrophicaceae bacterium]|jgi:hypothetical protein